MLRNRILSSLLLLAIPFVVSTVCQERKLSEDEYEKVTGAAQSASYDRTVRITMMSEHFEKASGDKAVRTIQEITEYNALDNRRKLRIDKGKKETREEEKIFIGDDEYTRVNKGVWTKQTRAAGLGVALGGIGSSTGSIKGSEPNLRKKEFTFRYLGKVNVDGKNVDLYESEKFRDYQLSPDTHYAYTIVERTWILSDGTIFKRDSRTIQANDRISLSIVWDYEYPEKIQIEAPIK